jgi:hypothetical protein
MKFTNETPFSADLLASIIDAERSTASVLLRVTYGFAEGPLLGLSPLKRLAVAPEQPWKVSRAPWDSPRGKMETDMPFMKGGVDLFVWGVARPPKGKPVDHMEVGVELSPPDPDKDTRPVFLRRASVSGKRVWIRRDGAHLVPSAAGLFLEMPLTLEKAFGGKGEWDGLEVPWMENPAGIGFCMFEAEAEGTPLPHLEEPDAPMKAWNDRPPVCGFGFCPMHNQARFKNGLVITEEGEIKEKRPQLFNAAYPPMIAPEARPGDILRVNGVLESGPLELILPEPPVVVKLRFGEKVAERIPYIEQVGVEVDIARVFVTYRFPFRYVVKERELREATLSMRAE